jgi:Tfp pilus assembly protein PilO
MTKSLAALGLRIARVKPWLFVAILMGVVIFGYYVVLGMRYISASGSISSLRKQIDTISFTLRREKVADENVVKTQYDARLQRQDSLKQLFNYPDTEDLIAIISSTAHKSSVNLTRVSVGSSRTEVIGDVLYRAQPMTLIMQGDTQNIYSFLSQLRNNVPAAKLSDVSLSSIETAPQAQVQLLFYLFPEPAPEKKGTK